MRILWMTWKDTKNPQAGGAEFINEQICKRLASSGHEVILLVANFNSGKDEEINNGYKVIRLGGRFTVYWHAYKYYKKYLIGWADLVIDEMNTIPFFCKYYVKERNILLVYQLCREIWFYQMKFPFSMIGYVLEPIYLWLLNDRFVITESESTKLDLQKYGFISDNISIIPIGIDDEESLFPHSKDKFSEPTLLSLGTIRAMKQTLDQIYAFEIAKKHIPNLKLKIAGNADGGYGKQVLHRIKTSIHSKDIEYFGRVDSIKRVELMCKSHFILVTSVKEGWGLIVTEANRQGTPAIVYDADGLRDSVKNDITGIISKNNKPHDLSLAIINGFSSFDKYEQMKISALRWSRDFTLENCFLSFAKIILSKS